MFLFGRINRWALSLGGIATLALLAALSQRAAADDFVIYSVQRAMDFGNVGETPQKDYYINMGSLQGIRKGTVLEVLRREPTFDVRNEKLYKDVTFPFARLKVIHVESNAAIARLEKMIPVDQAPTIIPPAIMMGDLVRRAE